MFRPSDGAHAHRFRRWTRGRRVERGRATEIEGRATEARKAGDVQLVVGVPFGDAPTRMSRLDRVPLERFINQALGRKIVLSLSGGATMAVAIDSCIVPDAAPTGSVYLGVVLDEFDHITEVSETNNTAVLPLGVTSSPPDSVTWIRQFGTIHQDRALSIVAVDTTSLLVGGQTTGTLPGQAGADGVDAYVRVYDAAGNEMWTRQFGTAATDRVSGVVVGTSGVFVAGATGGVLDGQTGAGGMDAFLRKYDAAGSALWTRQFGTSAAEEAAGVAWDATGVYVVGYTSGVLPGEATAGGIDGFVRK